MTKSAQDYYEAGIKNLHNKNYEAAMADFDKAIDLDPKFTYAYLNRGVAYSHLGQDNAAIYDYDKAIDIDPKLPHAYYFRAISSGHLALYEAAIDDCTNAINRGLKTADVYKTRGLSKTSLGQYKAAIDDYSKAIKVDPKSERLYFFRGASKAGLGQYKAAIADYSKAIKTGPKDMEAYYNRGFSYAKLGKHQAAISDYNEVIKIEPEHGGALYNRGCAYQKLGKTNEAENDFLKVIPLTREDPPKSLYKYIPFKEHHLLSLINNEVYFTLPTQLNDPLECFFLNRDSEMGKYFQQNDIEPRICSMVKECPDTEGLRSTLMFAHYANDHKGICVEYKIDIKQFDHNDRIAYGEVVYEQKKETENLKDLYMLKDPAWKYEEEFRFVRFDNKEYIEAKVKKITFGLKCPQTHRDIIRHLLPSNIDYSEMSHENKGNQIIKKKVDWADKTANKSDIFKLMLKENLAHLYFYHQNQTK